MRIGILTLPLHTNYGGILQAYALQTVLERIGHEVEIINVPFTLPSISKVTIVKRIIKKILGKYPGYINYEGKFNKWLPIVAQNLQSFKDKYIHMSHIYDDYSAISSNDYDCIVVGSDQIWRPRMLLSDISNAYLSFAEGWNIKRIAYSASFGTQNWEYTSVQTEKCKKLLKMFDAVIITAKPKAHAFKNEMCFPLTKTKCELKKHPNSKFECFFNDFNRTRTSLFLPFPSKLIQDNLVCVLELQE